MFAYLDNNGTTPLKPEVEAIVAEHLDVYGNPSSAHQIGQTARMAVDTARRNMADAFGVRSEQVVFTSSGTEANVLAIKGVISAAKNKRLITSPTEHSSVYNTAKALESEGVDVVMLPVDKAGVVDLTALEAELQKAPTALVSIMWANNETGVIQPIEKIVALAKKHGAYAHVDAVQWAGKEPCSFPVLGADAMTLSCHKFGGPKGCGTLILRNEVEMNAVITGGGQERNRRAGTENVLGIVGAGEAVKYIDDNIKKNADILALRTMLEDGIKDCASSAIIVGEYAERLPTTTAVIVPNLSGELAVMSLDMAGVCISQGSACSSGKSVPSRVLQAQGFTADEALCGLRISLAWHNTEDDIKKFLQAFKELINRFNLNG